METRYIVCIVQLIFIIVFIILSWGLKKQKIENELKKKLERSELEVTMTNLLAGYYSYPDTPEGNAKKKEIVDQMKVVLGEIKKLEDKL